MHAPAYDNNNNAAPGRGGGEYVAIRDKRRIKFRMTYDNCVITRKSNPFLED